MAIYTVHLPPVTGNRLADAEQARLVPETYSWGALVWGPLWLLGNRAWLGLVAWIAAVGATVLAFEAMQHPARGAEFIVFLLIAVFFGFEGRQFVRAKWERRGYRLADVVNGRDARDAERAFFERWLAADGAPRPGSQTIKPRPQPPGEGDVIGLFPEAGGRT